MANMSYCRFENTANDVQDCVRALQDGDLPLSRYERGSAKRLRRLALEYLDLYDTYAELIERED